MVLRSIMLGFILCALYCSELLKASSSHVLQGGVKQIESGQYSSNGEKGQEAYIGLHQLVKGNKGQHDKENHQKYYNKENGKRQGYNHEDDYYSQRHQGEKGQKGYHFEDKGSYSKGHSIKGHHKINKLNEFKKNTDFFDEDNDEGFAEKHGSYETAKETKLGKSDGGGFYKKFYIDGNYGKIGISDRNSHYDHDNGYKNAEGHDDYYNHHAKFDQKGGQNGFKKFGFNQHN